MKEPGLDGRHRNKSAPKKGEIQQKRSDTLVLLGSTAEPDTGPSETAVELAGGVRSPF
jgi:hypothetical protein